MNQESNKGAAHRSHLVGENVTWRGDFLKLYNAIRNALVDPRLINQCGETIAHQVTAAIVDAIGGRVIYIPLGFEMAKSRRNREIYKALRDGTATAKELAISYDLAVTSIYTISANMHEKYGDLVAGDCTPDFLQRSARRSRNREIRDALRLKLATPLELSKKHGLSLAHIHRIARETSNLPQERNQ